MVVYNGLDCVADIKTSAFMAAMNQSQAMIPFASQAAYGKYTVYFGVVVIFVAFLKYLWTLGRDRMYLKSQKRSGYASSVMDVIIAYSRYVGYSQIPSRICYYTSLPSSLGSTLFMFVSSLYLYCYAFVPHFWYRECRGFGAPPLAVRTGIMATALTPFIYVLAGKSNMITLLTGFSYEKLNVYHQYVGVTALILSIIHTVPFIHQELREGGNSRLAFKFKSQPYYSGIPPFVLLVVLCVASKAAVRKRIYETFYHLHWASGIAYVGTLMWHIGHTLDCQDYVWGAVAFWGSQLLYRILVKTAFKPNRMFLKPRVAFIKKLNERAFEIVVENTEGYQWGPGQHVFLRFAGSRILDNHPFSICSMEDKDERSPMKFIIVAKKGLTGKLHGMLTDDAVQKKVYIDGAYGGSPRNHFAFDRVILMASGSGVTATVPFLVSLAQHVAKCRTSGTSFVTKGINFIWIVPQDEVIGWVREELDKCQALAGDIIKVDIFVTRTQSATCDVSSIDKKASLKIDEKMSDTEKEVSSADSLFEGAAVHFFKPDVAALLHKLQPTLLRRNMIVSSGSDSMKMRVSSKVGDMQRMVLNNSVEEIYLHTESFGW